jgi:hypothetical protein
MTSGKPNDRAGYIRPDLLDRFEPGDEQCGDYTRERLEQMDRAFTERVERALRDGREHGPREPHVAHAPRR